MQENQLSIATRCSKRGCKLQGKLHTNHKWYCVDHKPRSKIFEVVCPKCGGEDVFNREEEFTGANRYCDHCNTVMVPK